MFTLPLLQCFLSLNYSVVRTVRPNFMSTTENFVKFSGLQQFFLSLSTTVSHLGSLE